MQAIALIKKLNEMTYYKMTAFQKLGSLVPCKSFERNWKTARSCMDAMSQRQSRLLWTAAWKQRVCHFPVIRSVLNVPETFSKSLPFREREQQGKRRCGVRKLKWKMLTEEKGTLSLKEGILWYPTQQKQTRKKVEIPSYYLCHGLVDRTPQS